MSGSSPEKKPLRILIVRIGAMGDVLHAMPAVTALREQMPEAHIGWAIETRWASLLAADTAQGSALVNSIHRVPVREWKASPLNFATAVSILALRRELRAEKYDLVVDLQGTIRSGFVGRLAGAARFAGSATPWETPVRLFYTQKIAIRQTHVVEQACQILGGAVGLDLAPVMPVLEKNAAAEAWCDDVVKDLPRFVLLSAGGGWGAKCWPPERYGAVATALQQRGHTVLVAATGDRDELAVRTVAASEGSAQGVICNLPQLGALLRRASLCIAGDTGPLHLAAALGTPVVGIYGPTDPARNGPFTEKKLILRSLESTTDHSRHAETEPGLLHISVEDVIHSAVELLQSTQ